MAKVINKVISTETLALVECTDGFWLYDTTQGINVAMKAKTERDAWIEAITYYQRRLTREVAEHKALSAKVDSFLIQFPREECNCDEY